MNLNLQRCIILKRLLYYNEMENNNSIIITEPSIVSYYQENPNLNIVNMNLIFIDILSG